MAQPPLLVNAAELLRDPGNHRHLALALPAPDVGVDHPAVSDDVVVDVELVSTIDDVVVSGRIDVPWRGTCRRCLRPLVETARIHVEERYADDPDLVERGEAAAIVRGQIDLTPLVRDEVLLTAAEDRLCRPDCAGLCPTCGRDRNEGPCGCDNSPTDERWSVLDQLRRPDA